MSNGKKLELIRGLGPWTSAAIVIGTMIGTGIFLKPAEMAADAGSLAIVFAAWIVGGILSLFGALAFAELGAAIPEAGGEYAYLRRGFGPVWGFMFGQQNVCAKTTGLTNVMLGHDKEHCMAPCRTLLQDDRFTVQVSPFVGEPSVRIGVGRIIEHQQ